MNSTILMYVCLVGLALLLPICVFLWLREHDFHPFDGLMSRFRRLPRLAQLALIVFVANLIVYGSTKTSTNAPSGDASSPTNAPLTRLMGPLMALLPPFVSGFTDNEIALGYAVWRVGTNETWTFSAPSDSVTVAEWLMRGADEDWQSLADISLPHTMTSNGGVVDCESGLERSAISLPMSLVPEANWGLLGSNLTSVAWARLAPWGSSLLGWQNGLLGRDTNTPVSVMAEISRDGDVLFCYDLSRAGSDITNGMARISCNGCSVGVPLETNVTSVLFYKLRPSDLEQSDRDGDGISTWDEINTYHSDPGLVDSDGDGIPDGEEIQNGTSPIVQSVPNEQIVARVTGSSTNALYRRATVNEAKTQMALRLWDGFAADWSGQATNLVFERTLSLGDNEWQHYFLSSSPTGAGDWDLRGLVLEWDDGAGQCGSVVASRVGDSFYLPLTNGSGQVTLRLRATDGMIRSAKPMYLVGYVPTIEIDGAIHVRDQGGQELALAIVADESTSFSVRIGREGRPSASPLNPAETELTELFEMEELSGGRFVYSGNAMGGTITMYGTGEYELPKAEVSTPSTRALRLSRGSGRMLVFLRPRVSYGGEHVYESRSLVFDPLTETYAVTNRYPINSRCLWRSWQQDVTGRYLCECEPEVSSGADQLSYVTADSSVADDVATGNVYVYGQQVWTGTARHRWWSAARGAFGNELLTELNECETCEDTCENGRCDSSDGPQANSVSFRSSLGAPRKGQYSGFLWFESDGPLTITPSVFKTHLRSDSAVTVSHAGSAVTYACTDNRGRDTVVEPMVNGVRLTVNTHATGQLEHAWEITNVGGAADTIRFRQISRLQNVMRDETYSYEGGDWTIADNISGVVETLERYDSLNDWYGEYSETRTWRSADGTLLRGESTEMTPIGEGAFAVLRETSRADYTAEGWQHRYADYWDDETHPARHGQVRVICGDNIAWEYHDYDVDGRETLRVEQRNGSSRPWTYPRLDASSQLVLPTNIGDAFVTVFGYAPLSGDSQASDDYDKARQETRFAVKGGAAVCIARSWCRYTHVTSSGFPAVKCETWRASSPNCGWNDPSNAYSYEICFSETASGIPLVLRGRVARSRDEDGTETVHAYSLDGERVVEEIRRTLDAVDFPTYERIELDATYGNELRRSTFLTEGNVRIEDEVSLYDEKNRLRSTTYADGTFVTNAYSCCRLLWSQDRQGRKTLRSAVTGQDRLYYAEEEVWLRELGTNDAHKTTQHFLDGLGRETNVVAYVASVPGEATDKTASSGKPCACSTTAYPSGTDDYSVSFDARGAKTLSRRYERSDRTESTVREFASASAATPSKTTRSIQYRGGASVTEKTWDDKWTRETEICDYDAAGCEVRRTVTESSDCGTVTNRVSHFDFLGRMVLEETPLGNIATTYHGSSSRADVTTFTAGNVTRISTALYSDWGENVGGVQDGVTRRTDENYASDDGGAWWKVTREEVSAGGDVESVTERREQLTDRAAGVISREIAIDVDGVTEETVERFGETDGERVTIFSNAVAGVTVRTSRRGRVTALRTPERTEANAYDSFGRQIGRMRVVAGGAAGVRALPCETVEYNVVGDVVARRAYTNEVAFVSETYDYDSFGRRVRTVDALGNEKMTAYDAVGNVVEESGATYPVRYGYDTAGRRVSLSTTKDGRIWDVTTWGYDPSTGKCTVKRYSDGSQVAYSCTPDGLPLVTTLASGRTTTSVYDAKRMQVGSLSSDGAGDATYAYDAFGKMTASSNAVAAYTYVPHRNGIITNETVTVGETSREIVRTIDAFGRLSGRQVSGGAQQTVTYDAANRVATIATTDAVATYAYGDDGTDLGLTLTLANGTVVTRQIVRDDYRQQVVSVSNFVNGAAVRGFAYGRDALGRIVRRDEAGGDTTTFAYDEVGQVVQVSSCPLLSTNYQLSSYSYDQIGNIAGSETLAYTTDGGVAGLDGKTFTYDSAMRLTSVTTGGVTVASYAYDAFGRRVRKTTPSATTRYFYDGWNLVREETDDDTVDYVWGKDIAGSLDGAGGVGGLLYLKRNGTVYVPLYDANGNIVAYVDAAGAVVSEYAYDAFGNAALPTANDFSFRYSTKYWDAETGFYYYGYRYYAPTQARWLTRDPLEEQGGLNIHAFCENDGVNKYDALGQWAAWDEFIQTGRYFWMNVAEYYFRRKKNCPLSAMLLDLSVSGLGVDHHELFEERSDLAVAIRRSREYRLALDKIVKKSNRNMVVRNELSVPLNFTQGDLFTAVGHATLYYRGRICKTSRGGRLVNLSTTFPTHKTMRLTA